MRLRTALLIMVVAAVSWASAGFAQWLPSPLDKTQGAPTDWSHRHLIFSHPSDPQALDKVQQEPRYWLQQMQRSGAAAVATDDSGVAVSGANSQAKRRRKRPKKIPLKRDWSENMGSLAKVGAGQFPAKFSFNNGAVSCANDFVVYNTGLAGSPGQASIVAFNNLYKTTCGATVPTTFWAYNTGASPIVTSVVFSLNGSQVAFAQGSNLVLLKWSTGAGNGTLAAPVTLTSVMASAYRACTAPCMTTLALGATDTNSAPFVDYANDVIYVGDNNTRLHKFQNVFLSGTPAEATNWPSTSGVFSSNGGFGSPVFDPVSGNVFVADVNGNGGHPGGFLYHVSGGVTPGTPVSSTQLDQNNNVTDPPVVDSAAGKVYFFAADDGNNRSGVFQLPINFLSGAGGTETTVGSSSSGSVILRAGAFDNIYLTSASGASPTGNLYVCANAGGNATLNRIPITANVMGAASAMTTALSTANTPCSPVTEILNGVVDFIFMSVQASGNPAGAIGCPATGCIASFNVTAGATPAATNSHTGEAGGTSGIIIDNTSATTGASQVYFSTLSNGTCTTSGGTGGCAVQASQAGLL